MIRLLHISRARGLLVVLTTTTAISMMSGISLAANSELTDDSCQAIKAIGGECGKSEGSIGDLMQRIVNALLFLIGGVSVIMIIIGGVRFVVSSGDQQAAANARNTVLYAVIGLIVAVSAYGIINFVLGRLY